MSFSLLAIRLRPGVTMLLLIGMTLGSVLLVSGPVAATADDEQTVVTNPVDGAIPDAIIQLGDSATFDDDFAALTAEVSQLAGVAWTASDLTRDPRQRLLVGFEPGGDRVALRSIDNFVDSHEARDRISVGGRAVVDGSIGEHLGRTIRLIVIMAALLAGAIAAFLSKPSHGGLVGLIVLLSGWLSSRLGQTAAGDFSGSLLATSLPAVFVALVVSVFVSFRLLTWFERPEGEDQAEMIRRSVFELGHELLVFFGGLVVSAIVLELFGSGRSMVTLVLVGALTASLLSLSILPPALAALHGSGLDQGCNGSRSSERAIALRSYVTSRLDRGSFPIALLVGFGLFFAFLGILAIRTATEPALLERSGTEAAVSGGDPTDGILAVFPAGADQQAKIAWLRSVSELPSVGRVDTSMARYIGGGAQTLDGAPLGAYAVRAEGDEAPGFALVVPTVTARSEAAAALLDGVKAADGLLNTELSGSIVEADEAGGLDRSVVWFTIIVLALVTGGAVFGVAGDPTLALLVTVLRLLDGMVVVGLYHLLVDGVSGPELLIVVLVTATGSALFELGLLRRLLSERQTGNTEEEIVSALGREGLAATLALIVVAAGALGLIGSIGPLTRLGIVLIVAIGLEVVVGLWLLRPAVLAQVAVLHVASRTVGRALRQLSGADGPDEPVFTALATAVTSLLHAEFRFQAAPAHPALDSVFAAESPAFHRAVEHHERLAGAGLRVVGRSPEIRSLQVVGAESALTIAATVDHPARQLVDRGGKVVGVRKAERRSLMLWLDSGSGGSHRIAESVELGSVELGPDLDLDLDLDVAPATAFAPAAQLSLE